MKWNEVDKNVYFNRDPESEGYNDRYINISYSRKDFQQTKKKLCQNITFLERFLVSDSIASDWRRGSRNSECWNVTLERLSTIYNEICKLVKTATFERVPSPWVDESSKFQCLAGREIRGTLGLLTVAFAFPKPKYFSYNGNSIFLEIYRIPLVETFTLASDGKKNYSFDKVTRITTPILYFLRISITLNSN